MPPILLLISLLCQLTGFFMHAQTYKYRTADYPWPEGWSVFKRWQPFWRMKQYFEPAGYRLEIWSVVLFFFGGLLQLAVYLVWGHGPY